jgi:hypothetical protein
MCDYTEYQSECECGALVHDDAAEHRCADCRCVLCSRCADAQGEVLRCEACDSKHTQQLDWDAIDEIEALKPVAHRPTTFAYTGADNDMRLEGMTYTIDEDGNE